MSVERQQGRAYQLDLFDEALLKDLRLKASKAGGTGTGVLGEQQTLAASAEPRALVHDAMERVASSANLNQAYKRVKANRGAPGVDGMTVDDLRPWLAVHKDALMVSLLDGSYRPQPVKGVEIPKPPFGRLRRRGAATGHPDGG